ncbi:MAG: amino acid adenylation domain-containing protein [SAR202 cluster bacterium]|nr:amino acid adenylation domain-containing protein [SAR202 cluster bacterium]
MGELTTLSTEELKKRAKGGDKHALQALRDQSFFEKKKPALEGFVLSNAQKRLWVIDQMLGGNSPAYNMPGSLLLEGRLDVPAFERALGELVRRHESLRTSFVRVDGEPRQRVHEALDFTLEHVDLRSHERPEEAALRFSRRYAAEPFDLERGPLFRAALLYLAGPDPDSLASDPPGESRYDFIYNLHHIICDEWSLGILVRELAELYRAFVRNMASPLSPLPVQYKDFAARQNRQLREESVAPHRHYWLRKFAGDLEPLDLTTDSIRPAVQTFTGDSVSATFDPDTSKALRGISHDLRVSLYVTLHSLVKALFHRYTGQEDITIGCPAAGREHHELENQIGFYVNTLALRDRVLSSDTFAQLIDRVRQTVIEGFEHQIYPFENILDDLKLSRDMSRSPLFDTMVVLGDDGQPLIDLEEVRVSDFDTGFVQAKFDFIFEFAEGDEDISFRLIYNRDLYAEERIRYMVRHLTNLARAAVGDPEAAIGTLELADVEERRLLESFNSPQSRYPADKTTYQLFEAQALATPTAESLVTWFEGRASQTPEHIAIQGAERDGQSFTYRKLNERADQLAGWLRGRGIETGDLVGLYMDRSVDVVVSILAILKAGAAYVPLDPMYPDERVAFMIQDAQIGHLVTRAGQADGLDLGASVQVVDLDRDAASIRQYSGGNSKSGAGPGDPAYVIYTSGSTGRPKGVIVTHANATRLFRSTERWFGFDDSDTWTLFHSYAFDFSVWEIWGALLYGGRLIVVPPQLSRSPADFLELLEREKVTVLNQTPSAFQQLIAADAEAEPALALRYVIFGGEALDHERLRPWFERHADTSPLLVNMYGITETTVHATYRPIRLSDLDRRRSLIGEPLPDLRLYIVDRFGNPSPLGVPGEIWVGGDGVARGYLHRPQLTAQKFTADPFRDYGKGRVYRSGDLARFLPDGDIEYLGRIDSQVQIRGFRVELGEIVTCLSAHPAVTEAVVIADQSESDSRLVAYCVPAAKEQPVAADLRRFLGEGLPDYMIPSHFVFLDAFPLTVNGKLDRASLPDPSMDTSGRSTAFVRPEGEIEERLSSIWQDILGVDRVGAEDEFLDLGGNSMKAIMLTWRVLKELELKLDIREVFEMLTVRKLAGLIRDRNRQTLLPIYPIPDAEHYAVSNAQRRLWIIDRMDVNRAAYNIASVTRLRGDLVQDTLERALSELAARHQSLRTRFVEIDGEPHQVVDQVADRFFHYDDLSGAPDPAAEARERAIGETGREFDLSQAPLFRATLYRVASNDHFLVFNMHHIISDGWSLDIILDELFELYRTFRAGGDPVLPPLRIQYRDYAQWQNDRIAAEMDGEIRFWTECLGGEIPVLDLPADAPRPAVQSFRGAIGHFDLSEDASSAIRELARRHETSLFTVCTAAVKILLHRYTGSDDIVVGAPVAGRTHPDLKDQVGFFVNMLPLRDHLAASDPVADLVKQVKSTIQTALDYSSYPFDLLVEKLDLDRDMGRNPLFDVVVSFRDAPARVEPILGLDVESVPFQPEISKFDLTFFFEESGDGSIGLAIEYSTDLFRPERIQRMADHLRKLVRSMARNPAADISTLDILTGVERTRLLADFNRSAIDYPKEATIAGLFEEQARRFPDRAAAVCEKNRFDYRQLNNLANQIAAAIRTRVDLGDEEPVGILLERSSWTAVAALAILKAGGAYLPLDSAYPAERLAFIIAESGCRLVLTENGHEDTLRSSCPPGLVTVDLASLLLDGDAGTPDPESRGTANSLAYIMYTSGSTGRPKGVQIEQKSVIRLVRNTNYVELSEEDCILQAGSLAFDASTFEIWGALLNGGCICFPCEDDLLEPGLLKRVIQDSRVTTMFMTTSLFNQMVDADPRVFSDLKRVLTGGENVSTKHVNRARETNPDLELIHCYGPTENTTFTTCHRVDHAYQEDIPLGRPIANTAVYVLDDNLQPCPIGIPGEICTGGDGVARGYLARPELTREKFVNNPFVENDTLYRTGDLGVWNDDGTLSFLGRVDDQVKIRGFRVEPGEIEYHLREHPAVNGACVLARQTAAATSELVGYYTAGAELDGKSLQDFLRKRLPHYMVPSHLLYMEHFPVNRSGKIDRSALPNVQVTTEREYRAPVTRSESAIARIVAAVLGSERVGLDDNFLELGGDSIRAIQVVSRLKQEKLTLKVKDLFQAENIGDLAGRVTSSAGGSSAERIVGTVPLTPIQEWFFLENEHDLHHFNQAVLLTCSDRLDETGVRDVFERLHHHHDMLRATFHSTSNGWTQEVRESPSISVESVDLLQSSNPAGALEEHAAQIQSSFDLSSGPLVKAVIYRMRDGDRLLIVIHHLLVDGVSWRILLEDLETGYGQIHRGRNIEFGDRTDTYLTWAEAQRQFAESDSLQADASFWQEAEETEVTDIPLDFTRTGVENLYCQTETAAVSLSEEETQALFTLPQRAYRADADVTLLTALGRALRRWHGGDATRVLLEGHGREPLDESLDLTRTVGWFTSMYPFVLRSAGADYWQAIRETKEDLRRVPRRGVSYGISNYLSTTPPTPSSRRPKLVFNYLGQFDTPLSGESRHEPVFSFTGESNGSVFGPRFQRQADLELTGIVSGERLHLSVMYHPDLHRKETVASFLEDYRQELLDVLDHCRAARTVEKTPTDFTNCSLSLPEYDTFLATTRWKPDDIDDVYPLSPMQAGLMYQDAVNRDSTAYFIQMSFTLRGALDVDCFRVAWEEVIERHMILRSIFVLDGLPEPLQMVLRHRPAEVLVEDISSLPTAEQDRRIHDFRTQDMERGFDLQSDPLLRFAVFRLGPIRHQVTWSYHHILIDGWSLGNLYNEFNHLYDARIHKRTDHLPPVRPYSRYIAWLQRFQASEARTFWSERLAGIEQVTSIPVLPGARPEEDYRMGEITFPLTGEESRAVSDLAQKTAVTISSLMQTAWAIILSRYQGSTDIVFGSIVSGRPSDLDHVEEMVGLFINAIPVRIRLDEDRPFDEFVKTVQDQAMEAEPYHYYPLAEIQTLTSFQQGIFDHLFVFENYPTDRIVSDNAPGRDMELTVENLSSHDETHYPFNLVVVPGDLIEFRLTFNLHIYPEEQILQVRDHLCTTLTQIIQDPSKPVGEIQILPATEKSRLAQFHGTVRQTPSSRTVLDLIDEQVRAEPGRSALIRDEAEMSYDSLNRRANQLARYLKDRFAIGPDDRVGILLDRTESMIVALLGVLKAGGAYLPIDPGQPAERIAFMLADSAAGVVLTESHHAGLLPDSGDGAIVCIDQVDREIRSLDEHAVGHRPAAQDAVYVIYTSGSTGKPKGCVVEHRNLFNYLTWASHHYFHSPDIGHFGLFSTLSFDLTVTSLFLPLIRGNTLTIYSSDAEMRDVFAHMLDPESRVDSLKITPSHISLIGEFGLSEATSIQVAIVGGEALLPDQVALLNNLNPPMRVFNEYGPTETTVGCIVSEVSPGAKQVLIGNPIANTHIYLLDGQKRVTPIGTPGEIYIAGSGVTRGYQNRDDLNAERFLDSPFNCSERMYRSGDLGRWLPDGNMEYLGRCDDQVKIRGHRIEPGEIESALLEHPRVDRAAVIATDGSDLSAYVVGAATAAELRSWLSRSLPDYMVPTWFISLEELPLTPNGKLDRRALPDPVRAAGARRATTDDDTPRDAIESRILEIWATVLQVETLGIHDDFFGLGGHSLKATQIVSRILMTMDVKLSLQEFFKHTTVARLAEHIRSVEKLDKLLRIQPAPNRETYELSHAQKRLWLLDRLGDSASYNVPQAYVIHGDLDVTALRHMLEMTIERHEVLRTTFVDIDGDPRQKILSAVPFALQEIDLVRSTNPEEDARGIVEQEAVLPFDLSHPPLLRVKLIKLEKRKHILTMNMHHIIGDGWSMNILFREMVELFSSFRAGERHSLVPLRIQYKDFSEWQNKQGFDREEKYWLAQLAGNPYGIRLPFDFPPAGDREFKGGLETRQIEGELLAALRLLAGLREVTLSNLFLALFKLFLFRLTKQEDLCVGVSVANRNHPDLEYLVGFFVNILPIRTTLSADMDFDALLDRVSQVSYEAYDHQDYPFDLMVEKLNPDRVANGQPLVNVLYAFQNYADVRVDIPVEGASAAADNGTGPRFEPFPFSVNTSKFDLTLFAFDDTDRLILHMEYDTALFRPETIQKYLVTLIRFASMVGGGASE